MYVQIISIQAPMGQIDTLRTFITEEFLPSLEKAAGFASANFLEQVDDRDNAKLVLYWDSQKDVENAHSTGLLLGTDSSLIARIPGARIQRQSYIMQAESQIETEHFIE